MQNQQLIDYIKQQLLTGATKEQISTALLKNGWNLADIDAGMKAAAPAPLVNLPMAEFKHKGKSHLTLYGVILLCLLIGGAIYYYKDAIIDSPMIQGWLMLGNPEDTALPVAEEQLPASPVPEATVPATSSYTDPENLFSLSYPSSGKIEQAADGKPVIELRDGENILMISVGTEKNSTLLGEKTVFAPVNSFPVYRYALPSTFPHVSNYMYEADLGTYDNTKLSIIFSVLDIGSGMTAKTEEVVNSLSVNKERIADSIRTKAANLALQKVKVAAELQFAKAKTYSGFCAGKSYLDAVKDIPKLASCVAAGTSYSVRVPLTEGFICLDNIGYLDKTSSLSGACKEASLPVSGPSLQ